MHAENFQFCLKKKVTVFSISFERVNVEKEMGVDIEKPFPVYCLITTFDIFVFWHFILFNVCLCLFLWTVQIYNNHTLIALSNLYFPIELFCTDEFRFCTHISKRMRKLWKIEVGSIKIFDFKINRGIFNA